MSETKEIQHSEIWDTAQDIEFIVSLAIDVIDGAIKSKGHGLERVSDPPGVVFFLPPGLGELRLSSLAKDKTLMSFSPPQPSLDPVLWSSLTPDERVGLGMKLIKGRSDIIDALLAAVREDWQEQYREMDETEADEKDRLPT